MRRVSSVNKDRIHRMYVDRKTIISQVSTVEKIDAIKGVHNQTSHVNENFLLFAGTFYENLLVLQKHYKKFYLHQQELEGFMQHLKEDQYQQSTETMIALIQELVEKYNQALLSLKRFEDSLSDDSHSKELLEILTTYQLQLGKVGVTLLEDETLAFQPSVFKNNIDYNEDYLTFLFDYQRGLVRRLFTVFRNIKANALHIFHTYGGTDKNTTTSGILLDKKY